ncbi:hypothetical protein cand_001990 [Cryptosporidium andersoni]|uniref:Uncharacterized protein n=1 Tax=Cryptosporidium andersoni TaxID=117008 RepID=A0A1J4MQV3_9CRYT|nr:hypothetical protein cand_001990 [Cryptosporidium andersoni]
MAILIKQVLFFTYLAILSNDYIEMTLAYLHIGNIQFDKSKLDPIIDDENGIPLFTSHECFNVIGNQIKSFKQFMWDRKDLLDTIMTPPVSPFRNDINNLNNNTRYFKVLMLQSKSETYKELLGIFITLQNICKYAFNIKNTLLYKELVEVLVSKLTDDINYLKKKEDKINHILNSHLFSDSEKLFREDLYKSRGEKKVKNIAVELLKHISKLWESSNF